MTNSEAAHEDMEEIPCFFADAREGTDESSVCSLNKVTAYDDDPASHEHDDSDLSDITADEVFETLPAQHPTDPTFTPITHEELVTSQLVDHFCLKIRRKTHTGEVRAFRYSNDGLLFRQVIHDQIVLPHVLKARVLHIHH